MASIKKRSRTAHRKDARTGQVRELEVEYWRARYRDDGGKEHVRHFDRRVDAQKWLDAATASLVAGTHVAPKTARMTVGEWCDTWLEGVRDPAPEYRPPGSRAYRADQGRVRRHAAVGSTAFPREGVNGEAAHGGQEGQRRHP
jgi:hypothetical protein